MEKLTPEEVKVLIKASQIAKEKGITKGASVRKFVKGQEYRGRRVINGWVRQINQ